MRTGWIACMALVVALTGLGTTSHAAAAEPSIATPVKTVRVDVDGDGRKDTVRVFELSQQLIRVAVTTAKGHSSSVDLTVEPDYSTASWRSAAKLDGNPGYELLVNEGSVDGVWFDVLTWRANRLVKEAGPAAPPGSNGSGWYLLGQGDYGQGMHLFTSRGRRFVDNASWTCGSYEADATCTAKVQRSVWRSGAWHKVKRFTRKHLTYAQVGRYDLTGVKETCRDA